jgi:hypothetical protein
MENKSVKKLDDICERDGDANLIILSEFEFLETIGVGE